MLIKTTSVPDSLRAHAARVHAFLRAGSPCDWQLEFRGPPSSQSTQPVLTLFPPAPADAYASKAEVTLFPTQLLQRLLDRQQSIDLGDCRIRLPELLRVRLNTSSLKNGYLTLPPISIEITNFPDPVAVGLLAEKDRQSFLLHLRGRVTNAPLEVRISF